MAYMEFGLLGPLQMTVSGRQIAVSSARGRAVLAVLVLNAGRQVSFTQLIDAVWGEDPPPSARNMLHTYVWRLRGLLAAAAGEGDRIVGCPSGYLLRADQDEVDVSRFERLFVEGQRMGTDDLATAAEMLHTALSLWRGEPLEDIALHGHYRLERERLAEQRVTAVEHRIDADLACGKHESVIGELRGLIGRYPLRERLVGQLMQALVRDGRQSEALVAFHQLRERLIEQVGVDPDPALCRLHESVLRGELRANPRPTPAPAVVPRQLPRDLSHWVGRGREMGQLTSLLGQAEAGSLVIISAIDGTAGVGKTALAVHWAHSVAHRFAEGQLYLNLRGHDIAPALDPHEALAQLLRSLGVASEHIPQGTEAAAALFRSVVAGRKVLILLDDAADAAQVRPLLPGSPPAVVLVTSRISLLGLAAFQDVHRITVDTFSPQDSITLLSEILEPERVADEPKAVAALADLCAHLPLALRIAAANLLDRASPRIASYVCELRSADLLGSLEVTGDKQAGLRAAFSLSYTNLNADARLTFRRLSLMPGQDITAPAVAALIGAGFHDTRRILNLLRAAHMVREHFHGRFTLHDLLRVYAAELAAAEETSAELCEARRRLFNWYLYSADAADRVLMPQRTHAPLGRDDPGCQPFAFGDHAHALDWCAAELPNIVMAAQAAAEVGEHAICWRLADAMLGFFTLRRTWPEWRAMAELAVNAARQAGERYGQASALSSLGNCYAESGRLREGLHCHEQALEIRRETGDRLECATLINIGAIHLRQNNLDGSIEYSQRALKVAIERDDPWGQCIALNNLGETYSRLQLFDTSLSFTRRALALFEKLGDMYGRGYALYNLGHLYRRTRRFEDSLRWLEQALEVRREIGDRQGQADTLVEIGDVWDEKGRKDLARPRWREALAIFDDLAAPEAATVRSRMARE